MKLSIKKVRYSTFSHCDFNVEYKSKNLLIVEINKSFRPHSSAGVSQGKRTNVKFCLTEGANLDLITGKLKTVEMLST